MRSAALTAALALALSVSVVAQPRMETAERPSPVALYDAPATPAAPVTLGRLFNAQTLRFSQSYEMSYSGGAGGSLGLGVYTAGLQWQPSHRLAARVDVGVAHSPFGSPGVQSALGFDQQPTRIFLRNAEVAYRPTDNALLTLSVQQSPYGSYASPYGIGGAPYGGVNRYSATLGTPGADRLFFRDGQ